MIVILAVALIVVGPDKLPELARSLAKGVNELKNTMNQVKESLSEESEVISSVQQDLQKTAGQMKTHLLKDVTSAPDSWRPEETTDKDKNAEAATANNDNDDIIEVESLAKRPWEEDAAAEPQKEAAMTSWRSENEEADNDEDEARPDQPDTVADHIAPDTDDSDSSENQEDNGTGLSNTPTSPAA
jgi:sec-independent protein translocase protein TatB